MHCCWASFLLLLFIIQDFTSGFLLGRLSAASHIYSQSLFFIYFVAEFSALLSKVYDGIMVQNGSHPTEGKGLSIGGHAVLATANFLSFGLVAALCLPLHVANYQVRLCMHDQYASHFRSLVFCFLTHHTDGLSQLCVPF